MEYNFHQNYKGFVKIFPNPFPINIAELDVAFSFSQTYQNIPLRKFECNRGKIVHICCTHTKTIFSYQFHPFTWHIAVLWVRLLMVLIVRYLLGTYDIFPVCWVLMIVKFHETVTYNTPISYSPLFLLENSSNTCHGKRQGDRSVLVIVLFCEKTVKIGNGFLTMRPSDFPLSYSLTESILTVN